jgi:hypothetical protein
MANILGARTTGTLTTETRLIRAVDDQIAMLEPNEAPLITILNATENMRKGENATKVEWFEDQYLPLWGVTDAAGYTAAATTINVADGTRFLAGDLFIVPTAVTVSTAPECIRVTSVSTNALTVVRGWAGTTAAAIAAAATPVRILGPAFGENAARGSARSTQLAPMYNNMEIFRTPFQASRSAMQSAAYGASMGEWNREVRKKGVEHKRFMNGAFLFGTKGSAVVAAETVRTCDGLNTIITSNVVDGGGTLTEKAFDAFLAAAFLDGSPMKYGVFCSKIIQAIHYWAKNKVQIKTETTSWGLALQTMVTPFGTLTLMHDRVLEHPPTGGTAGFGGMGFVVDPEHISYRYLNGNAPIGNSDTKLLELMPEQNLATDGAYGEYITEACPVFKQEKSHAKIFNVTDFS